MTISTSTNSVVYRGNGATTEFPTPFKVLDADHLRVTRRVFATGAMDYTYIGTDYSFSGLGDDSGTLTLAGAALDDDYELVIERIVPYKQELDIVNAGGFYPETVEEQLDLIVMGVQQAADLAGRGLTVPVGEAGMELPAASDRAGKFVAFDAEGAAVASSGTGSDSALRTDLAATGGPDLIGTDNGRSLSSTISGLPPVLRRPPLTIETIYNVGNSLSLTSYPHDTSGDPIIVKFADAIGATLDNNAVSGRTTADMQTDVFSDGVGLRTVPASATHMEGLESGHNDVIHLSTGGDRQARIEALSRMNLANMLWQSIPEGRNKIYAGSASSAPDGLAVAGSWSADSDLPGAYKATADEAVQQGTALNARYMVVFYLVKVVADVDPLGIAAIRVERDETNLDIFTVTSDATWVPTNAGQEWAVECRWFDAGEVLPELSMQYKVHSSSNGGEVSLIGFAGFSGLPGDDWPVFAPTDMYRWPADAYDDVSGSAANMLVVTNMMKKNMATAVRFGSNLQIMPMGSVIGPDYGLVGGTNFHYDETGAEACKTAWVDTINDPTPFAGSDFDTLISSMIASRGRGLAPGLTFLFDEALRLVIGRLAGSGIGLTAADNQIRMEAGADFVPLIDGVYDPDYRVRLIADANGAFFKAYKGRAILKGEFDKAFSVGRYEYSFPTCTVAQLPAAATAGAGARAMVTDSNAPLEDTSVGAIVAGGGSDIVPVYCDNTNWRIG